MTVRMKQIVSMVASLGLACAVALPVVVSAQADTLTVDDLGIDAIDGTVKLGSGDIRSTAARIINVALGFLGIIAVVIVLIGGFQYMISGGNETKTAEARQLIFAGIIGLAIILSAWAITSFVISRLVNATQDGSPN